MPAEGPWQMCNCEHNEDAHAQVTVLPHAAGMSIQLYARSCVQRFSEPVAWVPDGQTPASLAAMIAPPSVPLATQTEPEPQAGIQVMLPPLPPFPPLPVAPPAPAPPSCTRSVLEEQTPPPPSPTRHMSLLGCRHAMAGQRTSTLLQPACSQSDLIAFSAVASFT